MCRYRCPPPENNIYVGERGMGGHSSDRLVPIHPVQVLVGHLRRLPQDIACDFQSFSTRRCRHPSRGPYKRRASDANSDALTEIFADQRNASPDFRRVSARRTNSAWSSASRSPPAIRRAGMHLSQHPSARDRSPRRRRGPDYNPSPRSHFFYAPRWSDFS